MILELPPDTRLWVPTLARSLVTLPSVTDRHRLETLVPRSWCQPRVEA